MEIGPKPSWGPIRDQFILNAHAGVKEIRRNLHHLVRHFPVFVDNFLGNLNLFVDSGRRENVRPRQARGRIEPL